MSRMVDTQDDPTQRASEAAPLHEWLDRLGQDDGAPGGGSAAGVMLAMAAALLEMVLRYGDVTESERLRGQAAQARAVALERAREDARASAALGAALGRDEDDPDRENAVRRAGAGAVRSSAELGASGIHLTDLLREVAALARPSLMSDVGVAGEALAAGLGGALINLRANTALLARHGQDALPEAIAADARMAAARRAAEERAAAVREG